MIDAPIIFSRLGLDCLPMSYENNMGIGGMRGTKYNKLIMREADLIISIGTSLSVAFAGYELSFFNPEAKTYMIDIDPAEVMKIQHKLTKVIMCDAKTFLSSIKEFINATKPALKSNECGMWLSKCLDYKRTMSAKLLAKEQNPIDIYYLVKKIDELSKNEDIFIDDAGSIYYVAAQTLSFENGTREITSGAYASMGLSIPLSIGAAIANPNARVLVMTGDGSLETNIQELKTLSYYNLNVKIFVINNGGYISMRDHGRQTADERNAMLNLKKVADAYDMPYYLIDDYKQFDTYMPTFINERGPAFIEVMCDDKQKLILPI
jgi:acetolactate synthase-1/2/3 large subunit